MLVSVRAFAGMALASLFAGHLLMGAPAAFANPAPQLVNRDNVQDTDNALFELDQPRSSTTAIVNGTTYLFVGSTVDDGISVFSVGNDGTLTNVDNVDDASDPAFLLDGIRWVTTAEINGTTFLFAAGANEDGVTVFSVGNDGTLTHTDSVDDTEDAALELDLTVYVETAVVDGTTFLFAAGLLDHGVSVFSVSDAGVLTNVDNVDDTSDGAFELLEALTLATAAIDGTTYLFVGGHGDEGISVFSVANDGTLTHVDSVDSASSTAPALGNVQALTTGVSGGNTYLFAAGGSGDILSVFYVAADGTLTNVTNVADAWDTDFRFDNNHGVSTIVIDGVTYLLAVGRTDDGVSVFSVDADGMLTHETSVTDSDDASYEMNTAYSATAAAVNGRTFLFVPGATDDGLSVFEFTFAVPRVASIVRQTPATSATNADSLTWRVTFDEAVGGVTTDTFAVTGTTGTLAVVNNTTTQTDVTVSGGDLADLEGTVTLSLASSADASVTNVVNVDDDGTVALSGARGLATAQIGASRFLYAAGNADNGIAVFSIGSDGGLTHVEDVIDDGTLELEGVNDLAVLSIAGTTFLFATGQLDAGVSVFSIGNDGTLTNVDNVADDGTLELSQAYDIHAAYVAATPFLFVTGFSDHGVSVFSIANDGTLTNADNVPDAGALELLGASSVSTAFISGTTYLFVTGYSDRGISVFSVAGDGTLTNVDNVDDAEDAALNLFLANDAAITVVDGTTYLYVAGVADDGISIFSVASTGVLTNVGNVNDDATLEIDGAYYLTINTVGGTQYLYVVGAADDGVSIFSIGNDGLLTNVANIADDATLELDNGRGIVTVDIDGTNHFYVAAANDRGISGFSFDKPFARNVSGNAMTDFTPTGTNDNSFVVDNTAPRVTEIRRQTGETINSAPRWRVLFSEDVSNLGLADFTVSGTTGTLSQNVLTSTALDMQVSGGDIADLNGTVTLSFAGGQDITDLAGNALTNLVPTGLNQPSTIVDTIAPTVVVNIVEDDLRTGETSLVTFEFSEPVVIDSATETGGSLSDPLTQVDADSYTATFTLAVGAAEGRVDIGIDNEVCHDIAANPCAAGSDTVQRDVTPPVLTAFARNTPFGETTDADTLVFDITFSDNMLNVSEEDFLVTGTTGVPHAIGGSGAAYTLTVSGGNLASFNGTVGLDLAQVHDITDVGGIGLGAGEPQRDETYTVLNSAPRIASIERQTPATSPTTSDTLTWRVTFETDVTYTPPGAVLTNTDNVADDATFALGSASWVAAAEVNGTDYVFVTGSGDSGVSVFSAASDGTLTHVETVLDDGTLLLDGAHSAVTAVVAGTTYLFVASTTDSGVSVFSVANDGTLTNVDNVADDGTLLLDGARAAHTAVVGGTTYLFVASLTDSGVSVFSVANDGTLTNVENVADDATLELSFPRSLDTAVIAGTTYLFVAGTTDDGISVFSVANDGTLTNATNVADGPGLALDGAHDVTAITIDGRTYLYAAVINDDRVHVFEVNAAGQLNLIQTVIDDGSLELEGVIALTPTVINNQTYLIASGSRDNGISLFSVANNGTLTSVQNIADDATLLLQSVRNGAIAVVGDQTFFIVASLSDNGVSVFSIAPDGAASSNFTVAGTTATATETRVSSSVIDVTASGGDLAGLDGTVTLSVSGTQDFADLAGNALTETTPTGTNNNTFDVDNTAPVLTAFARNTPASSTTNADTLVWDITFNEAVQNVTADDFQITSTTATGVLAGSGAAYTLTVSGGNLADLGGSLVRLNLAGGQDITDLAGHALPAGEPATDESYQVDNLPPVLSEIRRNTPADEITGADTLVFALTFNSLMNGVAADDFTVSGTTATASITSGADGDALYQLTLSGGDLATLNNATVGVSLSGSADTTDTAGNTISQQAPDTVQTYTMSNPVPPAVSIVFNTNPLPAGGDTILSFIIDNTANLVGASALEVTLDLPSGVVVSATPNWQTTCTGGTVTAVAGSGTISLAGGSVAAGASCIANADVTAAAVGSYVHTSGDLTSSLGNSGTATETLTVNDATAPRISAIERNTPNSSPTAADSLVWTVTFNEPVELQTEDVTLSGSTATLAVAEAVPPDQPEFSGGPVAPPPASTAAIWNVTASGGDLATFDGTVSLGFTGPALTNTDNVDDDDNAAHALTGARAVTTHTIGGVTYLFVGGGGFTDAERGFSVFSLDGNGDATFVTSVSDADDPAYRLFGVYGLAAATINSDHFVYALGRFESGMSVFQFDEVAGTLTNVQNVANSEDPNTFLSVPNDILYADLGAGNRILAIGSDSAGFSTWTVGNDGRVTSAFNFADDETVFLNRPLAFAGAAAGGVPYIVTGSRQEAGLSTFALDLDGSLTHADNLADSESADLHLGSIEAIDTEIIDGTFYIYVASANVQAVGESGGVSVFTIAPGGILTNVFNVSGAGLGYSIVSDLNSFYLDGSYYVAVRVSGKIVIYRANADGSLTLSEVFNNSDNASYRFGGLGQSHVFDIGSDPHMVVAGSTSDGFSLFSLANGPVPEDASGNALANFNPTGTNEPDFVVDNTAPVWNAVERETPGGENIGSATTSVVFRVTFSEDLGGALDTDDFTVSGAVTGTVTDVTAVTGSSVFDVTVGSLSGEGVFGIEMPGSISDGAGNVTNTPTPQTTTETYDRDVVAPQVASIERFDPTDNPTNADAVIWRVTFNEAVSNLNVSDFTVSGTTGSLSSVRQFSNRIEMRLSGGDVTNGDIIASLGFAAGQNITDQHGNALTNLSVIGTNDNNWQIDNNPPGVDVIFTDDTATAASTLVTWDISFFENQSNLTIDDFTLDTSPGVTASNLQITVDNGTSVQVTADLTGNGTAQLKFNANTDIVDDLGNGNGNNGFSAAYDDATFSVATVDTTVPTLTSIVRQTPAGEQTNADSLTWLVTFSKSVSADAADFALTGTSATLSVETVAADQAEFSGGPVAPAPAPLSPVWRVTASGGDLAGVSGTVSLALAAAPTINDTNGNALTNTAATGTVETYDVRNIAPALASITRLTPVGSPTSADSLVWRLTFSQIDGSFTLPANAFTVAGTTATVTDVSRFSIGLDVTVSGGDLAALNGNATLGLADSDFLDDYGNVMDRTIPAGAELTYTLDNTGPRLATITRFDPAASPTNADVLVFTATFDEGVQNVGVDDFAASGTSASVTGVVAQSATEYRVTVSGGDLAGLNGSVGVTLVNAVAIEDLSGNSLTERSATGTVQAYAVDNTGPGLQGFSRQSPQTSPTNADSLTWRLDFSEDVINVDAGDFAVAGTSGTLSVNLQAGNIVDVTASGGDLASVTGDVTLSVLPGNDITDALGNALTNLTGSAEHTPTYTLDNTSPSVSLSTDATIPSGPFTLTIAFSEAVTGFTVDDLVIANGTASDFAAVAPAGDGAPSPAPLPAFSDYTVTITPANDGPVTVDIAAGAANDAVGNPSLAASQFSILADLTAPRVASIVRLTPTVSPTDADVLTWRVTFSEPVANVTGDDFAVSGTTATVTGITTVSTAIYDVRVSGGNLANINAIVTLDFAGGQDIEDAAGIALADTAPTGTDQRSWSIINDQDAPRVASIRYAPPTLLNPTGSDSLHWRVTFSEAITYLDVTDFAVTGTTAVPSALTWVSGNSWDVTVSGGDLAGLNGAVTFALAADQNLADLAGNALADTTPTGVNVDTFVVDNTGSAAVLSRSGTRPVQGAFTMSVAFPEPVLGLTLDDFTVTNAALSDLTIIPHSFNGWPAGYETSYTILVTPSGDGLVTVDLGPGAAADLAGNDTLAAAQLSVIADTTAPRVASIRRRTPTELNPTGSDTLYWRVQFNEAVENVTAGDFAVTGTTGTVAVSPQAAALPPSVVTSEGGPGWSMPAVSPTTYDITVSGGDLADLDGVVTLSFAGGQDITDEAGNALTDTTPTGANVNFFNVDNTGPSVSITTSDSAPVSGAFTIVVNVSEPVSGFALDDVVVGNGTASNLTIVPDTWTGWPVGYETIFMITITPSGEGNVTVNLGAGAASDISGNGNLAASPFTILNDTLRTLTVTLPGVGAGTVTSAPAGIDCGTDCSEEYTLGTDVTLTAAAEDGSSFAGWTAGPCTGTSTASCSVTISTDQTVAARFTLDTPPEGRIVASTLPGARSGHVGGPAMSAFLSVVSRTTSPAQGCTVAAPAGAPVTLSYRQVDGSNMPIGPLDPLFDIPAGGTLSFVLEMTPTAVTAAGGYDFLPVITCENASLDPIVGVNSVLLNIGAAPTPDILSSSATPSGDGVIRIPAAGGVGIMSAAALNIGVGDGSGGPNDVTLTVTADTGAAVLPVTIDLCQIDSTTAACLTPRATSVTVPMSGSTPLFFAAFVRDTSTGGIAFDPANARVFLRFSDATGAIRSATSAAVTAPSPSADEAEFAGALPAGRWSVLVRQPAGSWPGLARASLYVFDDGAALIDTGSEITTVALESAATGEADGIARFRTGHLDGYWTAQGDIRIGAPWADTVGELWGVRDARSDQPSGSIEPGRYEAREAHRGEGLTVSADGAINGVLGGCLVAGRAGSPSTGAPGLTVADLTFSSCAQAGRYRAVMDAAANDNETPLLIVGGPGGGWHLAR